MTERVVDAWMQHPTLRHSNHEMFDSLRRWMGTDHGFDPEIPLEVTIGVMDDGGVAVGLAAAGGRHKVMFGTNYPMITPAKALENLDDLGLDGDTRAAFLAGTADRVFGLTTPRADR